MKATKSMRAMSESEYEALVADQLDKEKKLVQAHNEWKAACQRLLDWKQRK